MSKRCKVTISFTADAPRAAGRFVAELCEVWNQHPGITNQGVEFHVSVTEWKTSSIPSAIADPTSWPR